MYRQLHHASIVIDPILPGQGSGSVKHDVPRWFGSWGFVPSVRGLPQHRDLLETQQISSLNLQAVIVKKATTQPIRRRP
jgi:hypothetical protein